MVTWAFMLNFYWSTENFHIDTVPINIGEGAKISGFKNECYSQRTHDHNMFILSIDLHMHCSDLH